MALHKTHLPDSDALAAARCIGHLSHHYEKLAHGMLKAQTLALYDMVPEVQPSWQGPA